MNRAYTWTIDIDALRKSSIGKLVPISGTDGKTGRHYDYFAYLADPLPIEVSLSPETWTAVAKAEARLARLDEAARQIPDPSLLRRPALRREAQATSALEGTYAPLVEVLESEPEERGQLSLELREILNYVVAAEEAFRWIEERPITAGTIANLQGLLVQGTVGEYDDAGRLRDRQVFIGPRDAPIESARFVPAPPGDQLTAGFDDWVSWVNSPPKLPVVVLAAMAHYQFETLHPFSDGNGRIGRLLIVLQLMQASVIVHPILVVSPWFEARQSQYQDHLLALSETGEWDDWIRFFATGVGVAAETTHARVVELISWQSDALSAVRDAGITGVGERLSHELIGAPVLRASAVARRYGVTHQAAMNGLRKLAQVGLLEERTLKNRVSFIVPEVLRIISQ